MSPEEVIAKLSSTGTPPDSESTLKFSVGLKGAISLFEEETLPFIADGGSELKFVYAPYGRGKTHFLRTLQLVAQKNGFVTSYVDCNEGQAPFASIGDTYRSVANNLLPPGPANGVSVKRGPDAIIEDAVGSCELRDGKRRVRRVFKDPNLAADFRNLAAAYGQKVLQRKELGSPGLELRALLKSDMSYRVKVSDLYRTDNRLPRPIGKLSRRNAAAWLRSLASLPSSLEYPGLAVFFDETEQTLSLLRPGLKKRRMHLANLRNFVDHMALGSFRGCVIYYAVVEEFLEVARTDLEALSQRIERIRLGNGSKFCNPRAVWVDLDELTNPAPGIIEFYDRLGKNILIIGREAGLPEKFAFEIEQKLMELGRRCCQSINSGVVREYVKTAASYVAMGIPKK
jgi:hypothetical protein